MVRRRDAVSAGVSRLEETNRSRSGTGRHTSVLRPLHHLPEQLGECDTITVFHGGGNCVALYYLQ